MPPVGGASRAWLRTVFAIDNKVLSTLPGPPPVFLCPLVLRTSTIAALTQPPRQSGNWPRALRGRRYISGLSAAAVDTIPKTLGDISSGATPEEGSSGTRVPKRLPSQCPGCGAFSQTTHADQPGFYDLGRQSTMVYLGLHPRNTPRVRKEDVVVQEALRWLEVENGYEDARFNNLLRQQEGGSKHTGITAARQDENTTILCVRCHDLLHHGSGTPIHHPDINAIRETIAESHYKYNHVYHVLDAADFPMSLLPRINNLLDTMPLRSRNRRSQSGKFFGSRLTELSFVITRSDLFAPRRDQVDRLMPWIRDTLRDALGRLGRRVRLGNVHCVSARRNWWTSELREEIWKRGGANWLVGKANVGKSYLVHHVFPKGRMDAVEDKKPLLLMRKSNTGRYDLYSGHTGEAGLYDASRDTDLDSSTNEETLLPPRPPETNYPQMPVVSTLPGTTASPIRIPFGSGKGELIDLPGLERTALFDYVEESHKNSLVMKTYAKPKQIVLKGPWQSLLLGGFIRITPRTPNLVFLAYNFSPLREHKTMTEKAIAIQTQTSELNVENIAVANAAENISLAGSFQLKYDVTKLRAGPITRKDAANIRVERLPYRVVSLDLLIEGCGWVEIVAQVRTQDLFSERTSRRPEAMAETQATNTTEILQTLDLSEPEVAEHTDTIMDTGETVGEKERKAGGHHGQIQWPIIDVYSPGGKFVGSRRPLNAWLLAQPKASTKRKRTRARPKMSLKGAKKRDKASMRALGQ
ncbi:uncharacterized protein SPSK_00235 [Sporothrix schenckii 1099-18]|uniref:Genetic interactor of prohibitins 3, mitochondrial n=1 Tax=Sporothrix schenckii 1099-18 TaxID=1397361 RepID=A0A0F2M2F8_SPOSC|nr:uncharacterized protein SPSK_00235 [Sporothrix schenckii 1099-18]KJR83898.1 hypothetical protein SPSK_00235 [Sporothrix schenckii 1099-18]